MNPTSYQSQNSTFPLQAPSNPQRDFNPFRNSMNLASYQSQSSTCPPGFNPFRNSILASKRRDIVEGQTPIHPKAKRQRIAEISSVSEAVESAVGLLEEKFQLCKTASQAFPPDISSSHIHSAISRYEDAMTAASDRSICCSCSRFFPTTDIWKISELDDLLQLLEGHLDECGYHNGFWNFCISCHSAINRYKIPKFLFANYVNITTCQHYLPALKDLTPVEECLIAKCHPLGTILKLRPGGHTSPTNYI